MIIQLDGGSAEDLAAAKVGLASLASTWGHDLTESPAQSRERAGSENREERVIDPVSLTALIVSLPSAALAVVDLADRIHKRRRARQLIDQAHQLATQRIYTYVMQQNTPIEIATLDQDQLLDLLADQPHTSEPPVEAPATRRDRERREG